MNKDKKSQEKERKIHESKKIDQEIVREQKMKKLAQKGVDLFPHKIETTHSIRDIESEYGELTKDQLEEKKIKVIVPGRIMSIRKMGRATFFHIADSRGRLQAYLREDKVGKNNYELFSLIDIGDMVAVEGVLFMTKTGELTVLADNFVFLAKCLHPLPEKWHGIQDKEERYRKRYLDLIMNPDVKEAFEIRSKVINVLRSFLQEEGFMEVETPLIQPVYGGASAKPFITHINTLDIDAYLSVAPELYLKRLIVGGYEKIFTICKNFRNEGIDFAHNPEFTMVEYYAAYKDYKYHIDFIQRFFEKLRDELDLGDKINYRGKEISLKTSFKQIKFRDLLLNELGVDIDKANTFDKFKEEIEKRKTHNRALSSNARCHQWRSQRCLLGSTSQRSSSSQPAIIGHSSTDSLFHLFVGLCVLQTGVTVHPQPYSLANT
jgi:lysyl-tRNA synthetase class 2